MVGKLEQLAKILHESMYLPEKSSSGQTKYAQLCYEKLWRFNTDTFGCTLFAWHSLHLLRDTNQAESVFNTYLDQHLYHNARLDAGKAPDDYAPSDEDWLNMLYRGVNVAVSIWIRYYEFHEIKLMGATKTQAELKKYFTEYQQRVEAYHKTHKQSKKHIRRFVKGGGKGKRINKQPKQQIMPDRQLDKLASYILGHGKEQKLLALKNEMLTEIRKLLAGVDLKALNHTEMDALQQRAIDTKNALVAKHFPDISNVASGISNKAVTVVNMMLARVTYANFNDRIAQEGGNVEDYARLYSFTVGLVSDVVNTYHYKRYGISPTLSGKVAREMMGKGLSRTASAELAISLGRFQAIGGGAGGVLGVIWSAKDAADSYYMGSYNNFFLDLISATGCALSTGSLYFAATGVGVWIGFALNIVGFILIFGAQLAKSAQVLNPEMQSYCLSIAKNFNRFEEWKKESQLLTMGYQISDLNLNEIKEEREQDKEVLDRALRFIGTDNTYQQVKNMFGEISENKRDIGDHMLEGTKTHNPVF